MSPPSLVHTGLVQAFKSPCKLAEPQFPVFRLETRLSKLPYWSVVVTRDYAQG